jgi:hypothetical protein
MSISPAFVGPRVERSAGRTAGGLKPIPLHSCCEMLCCAVTYSYCSRILIDQPNAVRGRKLKKGQTKALKPMPNATFSFYNQEQGRIGIHRDMAVDNKALTILIAQYCILPG